MIMKEENEITQEVKDLLDSLERHGQNARRQKELNDLMDSLSAGTSLRGTISSNDEKRRKLYPLWWIVGAAAACLLLWLLARPALKETPKMNEEILVEETKITDSLENQEESEVFVNPVIKEEPLAEETPISPQKPQTKTDKPQKEIAEELLLAENAPTEPTDTSKIGSNTIPNVPEEPVAVQSPQRRVIRSLNLVCYECQKEPENLTKTNFEDKTIFDQPQDPNMKNGSLAFELKLH
jgi:hypothetical protein